MVVNACWCAFFFIVAGVSSVFGGRFSYNETFARDVMLPLSSAAFRDDPSGCLRRKLPNVKVRARSQGRLFADLLDET